MSLAPRLDLRQTQALVMTPQLQQAIRLLALSNLELDAALAEELEKNPLLTTGGEEASEAEAASEGGAGGMDDATPSEPAGADALIATGDAAADAPLDVDYAEETFHHDGASDAVPGGDGGGDAPDIDGMAAPAPSLREHLRAQAGERLGGIDRIVAEHLIDLVDDAGYLAAPPGEVAERLGLPADHVARVLAIVQGFDPAGVAARDLAECLALQAREADRYDPCMAALIANLDLLARGQLAQLRRLCAVDEEDLADMIRELRGYDPKPGLRFGGGGAAPVSPDVIVTRTKAGWAIELNAATLPRLLVDRRYHAELAVHGDRRSRAWLAECLAGANWLVKALDQRARTIVTVATEIVRLQEGFFLHGVAQLKPLTLRTVADAIGMHESTVSRVTSNKYLSCARGMFELKYFFTSGVPGADGEGASAQAVKSRIAKLIAAEGEAILSDDALVDLLRGEGFDLARRTVAKYREAIGLGSSVQRRRARAIGR